MEPLLSFVLKVPDTKAFHCLWHTGNPCGYNGQKELCMTLPSSVTSTMFSGHPARLKIIMYISIFFKAKGISHISNANLLNIFKLLLFI